MGHMWDIGSVSPHSPSGAINWASTGMGEAIAKAVADVSLPSGYTIVVGGALEP